MKWTTSEWELPRQAFQTSSCSKRSPSLKQTNREKPVQSRAQPLGKLAD